MIHFATKHTSNEMANQHSGHTAVATRMRTWQKKMKIVIKRKDKCRCARTDGTKTHRTIEVTLLGNGHSTFHMWTKHEQSVTHAKWKWNWYFNKKKTHMTGCNCRSWRTRQNILKERRERDGHRTVDRVTQKKHHVRYEFSFDSVAIKFPAPSRVTWYTLHNLILVFFFLN